MDIYGSRHVLGGLNQYDPRTEKFIHYLHDD